MVFRVTLMLILLIGLGFKLLESKTDISRSEKISQILDQEIKN